MKLLKYGLHGVKGRASGKISSYHRGGGHKKLYRYIDNHRYLRGVFGKILKIEKDPYRSSLIALVGYTNGVLCYNLLPEGLEVGSIVKNLPIYDKKVEDRVGISCAIGNVATGSLVHNIEFKPNSGGKIARSAGTCAVVMKNYGTSVLIKLPSGRMSLLPSDSYCTIGSVGNEGHKMVSIGKAGRSRWLGKRPHVRGYAMNPVDHPHGGRTKGGKLLRTPWGRLAKGVKTRKKNRW